MTSEKHVAPDPASTPHQVIAVEVDDDESVHGAYTISRESKIGQSPVEGPRMRDGTEPLSFRTSIKLPFAAFSN
jgi:hypothetical protein